MYNPTICSVCPCALFIDIAKASRIGNWRRLKAIGFKIEFGVWHGMRGKEASKTFIGASQDFHGRRRRYK